MIGVYFCVLTLSCSVPAEGKPLQAVDHGNGHANLTFLLNKQDSDHLVKKKSRRATAIFLCCFFVYKPPNFVGSTEVLSESESVLPIPVQTCYCASSGEATSRTCVCCKAERASASVCSFSSETILSSGLHSTSL